MNIILSAIPFFSKLRQVNFIFASLLIFILSFLFQNITIAEISQFKPMSYEQIISLSKPKWVMISPTGSNIAFSVRQGLIENNCNIDTLYLLNLKQNQQNKIFEAEEILQASWANEDNVLYFLVKDDGKYQIFRYNDEGKIILISVDNPISLFTISPDGSKIYYAVTKSNSDALTQHNIEEGYVYDWGKDTSLTFLQRKYRHKEWEEIWCQDLNSKKSYLITRLSYDNWLDHFNSVINQLQVSDDGQYLLFCINKLGREDLGGSSFISDVLVWNLNLQNWYNPLSDSIDIEQVPCWLDGKAFIFQQFSNSSDIPFIWMFDAESQRGDRLDWLKIPERINKFHWDSNLKVLYAISSRFLYRISFYEKHLEKIELPSFFDQIPSFDQKVHYLGFIKESSNEPPEIAIYDLKEKQTTILTSLNPQLINTNLGFVERIKVETNSGISSTGFLIHPIGEEPNKRYPIIIATYGFTGRFIADAEWHSSFPAQTLAGEGYLVLLLNNFGSAQGILENSEKARQLEGWNELELFERAVDLLVERGIGDSTKVGLYGWSHGAFLVNFLISHSQKFHVACLGEGGDYNPGTFWSCGLQAWPKIYDNMFGGPPWGSTLKNYLDFSPFFQVDKIRTPLLLEYGESGFIGLEMYIPLRYLGIPAELVIYDGEEHNFIKPKARLSSMARKVEWFNFWFFNKYNSNENKKTQYESWNKMREKAIKLNLLNESLIRLENND